MKQSLTSAFSVKFTILLTLFSIGSASATEYLMSASPRETPEQGQTLYAGFAEEIGKVLNAKVTYEHPDSWSAYKKNIQSRKYDIIFDEPHFAAWRLANLEDNPLVKLPGSLSFLLVTDANVSDIKTKDDLILRKICTLPSPSLGTLSAYAMYPSQMRQPIFLPIKGGFKEVMKKFHAGKCEAVILRESFFTKKLDEKTRNGLKVLEKSKALTNQGITVSNRIDSVQQKQLSAFLTSEQGRMAAKLILNRFSKQGVAFVAAEKDDYEGHNMLVDNMIFGW